MPPLGSKRATVHVELPEIITNPEKRAQQHAAAISNALDSTMKKTLREVRASGTIPINTAALAQSLRTSPPVQTGYTIQASFYSAGPAAIYANVMDKGRTPGKRLWFGWLLYGRGSERTPDGWRTGWVNRQMRDAVVALASKLQGDYNAQHAKKRKGVSRSRGKFEKQAAFLLARKVARNIIAKGIEAREFFHRYSRPGPAHSRLYSSLNQEIGNEMRRRGLAG